MSFPSFASCRYSITICTLILITAKNGWCVDNLQVIVINSNYNHSVVNSANNIESILHGLVNSGKNTTSSNTNNQITTPPTTANTNAYTPVTSAATTLQPVTRTPIQISAEHPQPESFGVAFSPYVRNDAFRMNGYTQEDIEKMLTVIQTKCHSIMTFEMGYYANPFFFGPYEATSTSKIASTAAQLNLGRNSSILTVSQGAYILASSFSSGRFPEIDAAFYSAQKANGIYSKTVSSITFFLQDPNDSYFVGITPNTAYYAALLLRQYLSQAHSQNLKLGIVVSFCAQILESNDSNEGKRFLLSLVSLTDYVICEMYPSAISALETSNEYSFEKVKVSFELIKSSFSRFAPSLEIILFTGIHPSHYSYEKQLYFVNNPLKIKRYWDEVERWSLTSHQKVYLHQAFDTFEKNEVGYGGNEILNGYWKRLEGGSFSVKGTNEVVSI